MKITTNNQWREFSDRHDVPAEVLVSQYDHLEESTTTGFFKYKGYWYHLSDFMRDPFEGWHGAKAECAWTGVLVRLSSDGEMFQVGCYRSWERTERHD